MRDNFQADSILISHLLTRPTIWLTAELGSRESRSREQFPAGNRVSAPDRSLADLVGAGTFQGCDNRIVVCPVFHALLKQHGFEKSKKVTCGNSCER